MKTSELVSGLEKLGYFVDRKDIGLSSECLAISGIDNYLIATVSEKYYGVLNTDIYTGYNETQEHNPIFRMLIKYAMTPLDEREDTKKYLVHLVPEEEGYLNLVESSHDGLDDALLLIDGDNTGGYQTEFTEKEYNELQSKYPRWLPKFDKDDQRFEEVAQ